MPLVRRVTGHSMTPSLKPGRIVIGLKSLRPRPGHIVIARQQGREVIKRIARVRPGAYYLLGDNPSHSTDSRHYGWVSRNNILAVTLGRSK